MGLQGKDASLDKVHDAAETEKHARCHNQLAMPNGPVPVKGEEDEA
eukprot:CAMPEP_0175847528 /NCGR_PEP_ID=MMETSP0107_2-20121207/23403_1 /TAXON_ID=195067 ORGANISM="Goniomonas pacifica, Strain CCMP1869" /NCGR_SAMPLE_ID=MMETSP0107_2 /ASSEMBLY_ACC=CAM_ASM_000203 /LENGTH=45 /DNA_ID= /DNA_START= /DNA_END= /DNA_ORIENTATION=